jgi:hypothetical protein
MQHDEATDGIEASRAQLEKAAAVFGRNLKLWRKAANWGQATAEDWGKSAGIPHVYCSQWNAIENAKAVSPGPFVFYALGTMNALIASKQFGLIQNRTLLDKVKAAEPITHPNGTPWNAGDFFNAYLGALEWPEEAIAARVPELDDRGAEAYSEGLRKAFSKLLAYSGLSTREGIKALLEYCDASTRDREEFAAIVAGLEDFTGEGLAPFWEGKIYAPQRWLDEWRKALGAANAVRIKSEG